MEDLVQFAVFAVFILFWLLGTGRKKSKRPTPPQQRSRPQAQPRRQPAPSAGASPRQQTAAPRPAASRATAPAPPARRQPETLADLLRDVLQGELPDATSVPEPEPAPEARSLEITVEVPPAEAVSLETLEPAGGKSHVAFHERYIDVPAEAPAPVAQHRYRLTPRTAREAVIWTAIFSQPKGME